MKNRTEPEKIFVTQLKNIYWLEKSLLKVFPRIRKAATTRYLKASLAGHFIATKQHVIRLEQIFEQMHLKNATKKSTFAEEIISNIVVGIKTTEKETRLRDLTLIENVWNIERYEINIYRELINKAYKLKNFNAIALLEETLIEEREAEETFQAIKEDTLRDELFFQETEMAGEYEAAE